MSVEKFFEVRGLFCRIYCFPKAEMTSQIALKIHIFCESSFGMEAAIYLKLRKHIYICHVTDRICAANKKGKFPVIF